MTTTNYVARLVPFNATCCQNQLQYKAIAFQASLQLRTALYHQVGLKSIPTIPHKIQAFENVATFVEFHDYLPQNQTQDGYPWCKVTSRFGSKPIL